MPVEYATRHVINGYTTVVREGALTPITPPFGFDFVALYSTCMFVRFRVASIVLVDMEYGKDIYGNFARNSCTCTSRQPKPPNQLTPLPKASMSSL